LSAPGTPAIGRTSQRHWSAAIRAGALVCPHDPALIDVSRRYFPSCASSASSSVAALASAPMPSRHRPAAVPPASSRTRTDRRAPLMRFRLLPFGVRWSRRTVRSNQLRTIPLRRCSATSAPTPGGRLARAVFSASRLRCFSQLRALETPPRGSFVADFFRTYVPDPRRLLSRPGRDRQSPGDAHGIHLIPFAVLLPSAGDDACSDVSHPPAVSPRAAASFIVAGSNACGVDHRLVAAAPGVWPRERTVPCDLPAPL